MIYLVIIFNPIEIFKIKLSNKKINNLRNSIITPNDIS